MTGDLHGHRASTDIADFGKEALKFDRLGRGAGGRALDITDDIFDGADQPAAHARGVEDVFGKKGGGGFSIRAGDAHAFERAVGVPEEFGGGIGHGSAGVLDHDDRAGRILRGFFHDGCCGSARAGFGDKFDTVGLRAGECEE